MQNAAPSLRDCLGQTWQLLHDRGGTNARHYRIGQHTLRIHADSESLRQFVFPALEHLAISEAPADLEVGLIEHATALDDWFGLDALTSQEPAIFLSRGAISALYKVETNCLTLLDHERRQAIFCCRDVARIPDYEAAFPLRDLFNFWLTANGEQLVHAAAVGDARSAVLIVGKGGSGKSTTALACLDSGLQYLGDDYVVVTPEESPRILSLYSSAKLTADGLTRLPRIAALGSHLAPASNGKTILYLQRQFGAQVRCELPLRAVFVPRITGQAQTRTTPLPPAAALLALAPSTILQLPGAGAESLKFLRSLVERVPCFSLELGTDLRDVANTVRDFLSHD